MAEAFAQALLLALQTNAESECSSQHQVCVGMFNYMTPLDKEQSLSATLAGHCTQQMLPQSA